MSCSICNVCFSRSSDNIWCLEIHKHNLSSQANKRSRRSEREANDEQTGRYCPSSMAGLLLILVMETCRQASPLSQPTHLSLPYSSPWSACPSCRPPPPPPPPPTHMSLWVLPPRPRPPSAFKPPFRSLPVSAAVQRWDVPTCMRWQGGSWEESCMQGGGGGERGWCCVFLFHPYSPVFVCWCSALAQQRNFKEEIVQMSFRTDSVLDVGRLWLDAKLRLEDIFMVRYFKCSVSCLFCFRLGLSRLWDVFTMTAGSFLEEHSNVQNYPGISKWWCNLSKSKTTV